MRYLYFHTISRKAFCYRQMAKGSLTCAIVSLVWDRHWRVSESVTQKKGEKIPPSSSVQATGFTSPALYQQAVCPLRFAVPVMVLVFSTGGTKLHDYRLADIKMVVQVPARSQTGFIIGRAFWLLPILPHHLLRHPCFDEVKYHSYVFAFFKFFSHDALKREIPVMILFKQLILLQLYVRTSLSHGRWRWHDGEAVGILDEVHNDNYGLRTLLPFTKTSTTIHYHDHYHCCVAIATAITTTAAAVPALG